MHLKSDAKYIAVAAQLMRRKGRVITLQKGLCLGFSRYGKWFGSLAVEREKEREFCNAIV